MIHVINSPNIRISTPRGAAGDLAVLHLKAGEGGGVGLVGLLGGVHEHVQGEGGGVGCKQRGYSQPLVIQTQSSYI